MRAVLAAISLVGLAGCFELPQPESSAEVAVDLPAASTAPSVADAETAVSALSAPAGATVKVK